MDRRYVLYSYSLGEFNGDVNSYLFPPERGLVLLTGNLGSRQEIGRYDGPLPVGSYQQIEALKRKAWLDTPLDTELMQPGMLSVTVGEVLDGKFDDLRGYVLHNIPQQMKPLLAEADRLVEATLQHPKRVVRGSGSAEKAEFEAGGVVAFRIVLKSVGREPAVIDNALESRDPESSGIQLMVEKDKPAEQLEDSERLWLELAVRNLTAVDMQKPPPDRRVTLAPGTELRILIKKKLLLSPGRYRARAFYNASAGKQGEEVVEGRLRIDLGRFGVVRPPRGK